MFFIKLISKIKLFFLSKKCLEIGRNVQVCFGFKCLSGNLIVGHNVVLTNAFIDASALVTIGDYTFFGYDVKLYTSNHKMESFGIERQRRICSKPIVVGKGVWVASNVIISGGVKIGDGSVIGAGSVVTRDIPPYTFVGGIPAREIYKIKPKGDE